MILQVPGYDLGLSTLLQRLGSHDPTCRCQEGIFVKAFWTPQGACTLALRQQGEQIEVETAGDGGPWCRDWMPRMFAFRPQELPRPCPHPGLFQLSRDLFRLKIGPVPWSFDVATAYVLQQRIAFRDAARSFTQLIQDYASTAPGPLPLRLPLSPEQWLKLGPDRIQRAGVDAKRARTLLRVAQLGLEFDPQQLARLRGIGPWTLESVRGYGFGEPDAVPTGDLHLPRVIGQFLGGEARANDERMLTLLEPYRGIRFRVINWIMRSSQRRAFGGLGPT